MILRTMAIIEFYNCMACNNMHLVGTPVQIKGGGGMSMFIIKGKRDVCCILFRSAF